MRPSFANPTLRRMPSWMLSRSDAVQIAQELLGLLDVGMRRRQRRLKDAQRLTSKLQRSMVLTGLVVAKAKSEARIANAWMVLRQYTPSKLKRLFLQNKSIVMPPKGKVHGSEIVHCLA